MKQDDLERKIEQYYKISKKTSGTFNFGVSKEKKAYIKEIFKNSIGEEIYKIIQKHNLEPKKLKLLDMGCGLGGVISTCEKNNIDAIGIDVDKDAVNIAKERIKKPENILIASGESLPFKENSFDIITSTCTIEHVNNPKKYLSEAYRVLKNKGLFIIYAPNHLFPWEGHYKMLWLPYALPYTKFIFKLYLIIRHKKTNFLNSLNFKITPNYLKSLLKNIGFKEIQNISMERFLKKIENPKEIANPGLEKIITKLKKNKLLNLFLGTLILFLKITKLYHPIIFTAKKSKHD
ncbi:class I SAM-dependent methyltransferase [Patescibacteria group bacterium]|nr:class I SAM-dependent methyltransferase [Patescibacteria group bacterium]